MDEFIWHPDAAFDVSQDSNSSLQCLACGRTFAKSNAYSTHVRSCQPQRKRVASALDSAKEFFKRKKARFNKPPAPQSPVLEPDLEIIGSSTEVRESCFYILFLF